MLFSKIMSSKRCVALLPASWICCCTSLQLRLNAAWIFCVVLRQLALFPSWKQRFDYWPLGAHMFSQCLSRWCRNPRISPDTPKTKVVPIGNFKSSNFLPSCVQNVLWNTSFEMETHLNHFSLQDATKSYLQAIQVLAPSKIQTRPMQFLPA